MELSVLRKSSMNEGGDESSSVKDLINGDKVLGNKLEGEEGLINRDSGEYKVYKMRFAGLIALIIFNIVCACKCSNIAFNSAHFAKT